MTKDNSNTRTPIIRFQGFNGEWKKKKIGDIAIVLQGYGFPEKYQGQKYGDLPFCKVGDISSAVDRGEMVINKADNFVDYSLLPVLHAQPIPAGSTIFAKIGEAIRSNKRIRTGVPCLIDNNAAAVKSKGEISDTFLFYLMSKVNLADYSGGIVPSVNKSTIEAIDVLVPSSRDEQQKIAECLEAIDQMISAQNQKVESLKINKKGLMQQLFPQPGATTPALRFPGFTGEWTQYKLGECFDERNEQFPESSDYPLMAFIAGKGVTEKGEKYDRSALVKDASNKKYKRTELGDFIYSSNNLESGSIGLNRYGKACISPVYSIFKAKKGFDPYFIGTILTQKSFISEMIKYRQGVVYGQWKIPEKEFLNLIIRIPSFAEQQKIAEFLEAEDQMIAAQEQKVESLKTHKKGLMQQLFPQPEK